MKVVGCCEDQRSDLTSSPDAGGILERKMLHTPSAGRPPLLPFLPRRLIKQFTAVSELAWVVFSVDWINDTFITECHNVTAAERMMGRYPQLLKKLLLRFEVWRQ